MDETFYQNGGADFSDEASCFIYVCDNGGVYKGWNPEILVDKIESKVEEMFLLCSSCRGVLRDACLVEREGKQELRCSPCIPESVYRSVAQMNRELVNDKKVRCPFKFKGCDWTDTISQLFPHLRKCVSFPVKCPLRCLSMEEEKQGEVTTIERGLMLEHQEDSCPMRFVKCDYCNISKVKACEINAHLQICQRFPIICPNDCNTLVERKYISEHLSKDCLLQIIECPFTPYGCEVKCKRAEIDQHEKNFVNAHLNFTILRMKSLEHEGEIKNSENRDLRDKLESLQSRGELEWEITGIRKKMENRERLLSESFNVGKYKVQAGMDWDINVGKDEEINCLLYNVTGEFDEELTWPFRFECSFVLVNQLNSEENYVKSTVRLQEDVKGYERPKRNQMRGIGVKFIPYSELLSDKYLKDDSVFLKVRVIKLQNW